ncbi:hypothetical protein HNP81_001768 [Peribacillus huizhouensis]|uniref:Uncharacterized protein n=1 Tax=Peribacillus huizhouensis TaxID=1501239 RepID=A0ABR6CN89_9BACI|nr:hypothetical protein [Peribacillus huizhouensis]
MTFPLNIRTTKRKKLAVSLDLARVSMVLLIALAHAPLYCTPLNLGSCIGWKVLTS